MYVHYLLVLRIKKRQKRHNFLWSSTSVNIFIIIIFQCNMEAVSGRQKGTFIYIHNEYTYNIDKRMKDTYRCSSRHSTGCPGVAKVINGQVHVQTVHQHPPETKKLEKSNMQSEMLRLSRESLQPLKEIFDNICRTYVLLY